jgi:sorbitol-specific phosphotransferase system component IIBC
MEKKDSLFGAFIKGIGSVVGILFSAAVDVADANAKNNKNSQHIAPFDAYERGDIYIDEFEKNVYGKK